MQRSVIQATRRLLRVKKRQGAGAVQNASRGSCAISIRDSVLECGGPPPPFPAKLLKANYLSLFIKKDLTNGIDGLFLRHEYE